MSEMVERAAKALEAASCRTAEGLRYFEDDARDILLAALDPHDSELQGVILGAMGFFRGEDFGPMARVQAHDAIAAIRNKLLSPQAELGVKSDG